MIAKKKNENSKNVNEDNEQSKLEKQKNDEEIRKMHIENMQK